MADCSLDTSDAVARQICFARSRCRSVAKKLLVIDARSGQSGAPRRQIMLLLATNGVAWRTAGGRRARQ